MNEPDRTKNQDLEAPQPDQTSAPTAGVSEQQMLFSAEWAAPYPPPVAMRAYEDIRPGSAADFFSMVKNDQDSRIRQIDSQIKQSEAQTDAAIEAAKTGQAIAVVLALSCLIAAGVFFAFNKNWAGTAFLSMPTVLLIRSFLIRSR